jgi:uncharacterized membrane protein
MPPQGTLTSGTIRAPREEVYHVDIASLPEASGPKGQRLADRFTGAIGTWWFLAAQTVFIVLWIAANVYAWVSRFDPYPFILLNLVFSVWSAYAAPIIMMSQNRQNERDRLRALVDHQTNLESHQEIEQIQRTLERINADKLDRILSLLERPS